MKSGQLDEDGCGILYYPSDRIQVMIHRVNGGKYYLFMDDASGDPIVASFNFAGIGFANYRNGKPRFVASATQGSLINEQGVPQQEWKWEKKGKPIELPTAVSFSINSSITLQVQSKFSIKMILKNKDNMTIEVGKPKGRGPRDRTQTTSPTLSPAIVATQHAQKMNWSLPRVSASGRETNCIVQSNHLLRGIVQLNRELVSSLHSYRTEIGRNLQQQEKTLNATWKNQQKNATTYASIPACVPSAKICKQHVKLRALPKYSSKKVDGMIQQAQCEFLVVLCSTRSTRECLKMEESLAVIEAEWRKEDTSNLASDGEVLERTHCIVLADCSTSSLFGRRHNFTVYPMVLMYHGGKLAFCNDKFNGFGTSQHDVRQQFHMTKRQCSAGTFLPANFRFP